MQKKQKNNLAKINWKPFSLKSVLVPVCAALLTLLAVIHGAEQQPVLPEFQNALAAVTARFYSMEYQSSDKKSRELFLPGYGTQITADAQTLQKK